MKCKGRIILILISLYFSFNLINTLELRSKFNIAFSAQIKKEDQKNTTATEEEKSKNGKIISEGWIKYIKYEDHTQPPQAFFKNPSFEKLENIPQEIKDKQVKKSFFISYRN
ncbi:MAG: hypothetical protein MJ252_09480 [archaeon]|nr:hypothetical protein [archaeon]